MTAIDFEKFEALSEEEQLSLKKTWGEREWCDYLEKGGYVSCEEFFKELKAAVVAEIEEKDGGTINNNEKEQMSLDIYERREYRQNGFVYLLEDEEKTAWIKKGRIKRCSRYRLPDHVMLNGVRYTIIGVEAGAYNHPRTLHHLVISDSIHDFDEYCFDSFKNLESIHLGKGWDYMDGWYFINCPKLRTIHIDKDNPYLKVHDGMVLSKDGKMVYLGFADRKHLTIPDGVEGIGQCAFWQHKKLETIQFPKTLRKIGDNSFSNCPKLRSVVLPEGFRECVVQSFIENENLNLIDFPSTFLKMGCQTMIDCPNLQTIVLRAPQVVETSDGHPYGGIPTDTCRLYVPAELVEQYREHPVWRAFKYIFPIETYLWEKK